MFFATGRIGAYTLIPGEGRGPEPGVRRWIISGSRIKSGKETDALDSDARRKPAPNPPPPQPRLDSARFFLRVQRRGRGGATPVSESRES